MSVWNGRMEDKVAHVREVLRRVVSMPSRRNRHMALPFILQSAYALRSVEIEKLRMSDWTASRGTISVQYSGGSKRRMIAIDQFTNNAISNQVSGNTHVDALVLLEAGRPCTINGMYRYLGVISRDMRFPMSLSDFRSVAIFMSAHDLQGQSIDLSDALVPHGEVSQVDGNNPDDPVLAPWELDILVKLPSPSGIPYYDWLVACGISRYTGMRFPDIMDLDSSDVVNMSGILCICHPAYRHVLPDMRLYIPVSPFLRESLAGVVERSGRLFPYADMKQRISNPCCCTWSIGLLWQREQLDGWQSTARLLVPHPCFGFHSLRTYFASELQRIGATRSEARFLLHGTICGRPPCLRRLQSIINNVR